MELKRLIASDHWPGEDFVTSMYLFFGLSHLPLLYCFSPLTSEFRERAIDLLFYFLTPVVDNSNQ